MKDCIESGNGGIGDSEERIHTMCYVWFYNEFPALRGLLCYNLGNSKNAIQGAKNRAMGIVKGRSDLVLYWQGGAYHIEVKTESGVQSPDQKAWQKLIESQGFSYYLIRSLSEFQKIILTILKK